MTQLRVLRLPAPRPRQLGKLRKLGQISRPSQRPILPKIEIPGRVSQILVGITSAMANTSSCCWRTVLILVDIRASRSEEPRG
jgi:hypothetical protein